MAAIAWSDVVNFAASLSTMPAGAQTAILDYVNGTLDADAFGGETASRLKLARIFLAAHLGTVRGTAGNANAVTQETITATSLSTSYAFQSAGAALESTSYGLEYKRLARLAFASRGLMVT